MLMFSLLAAIQWKSSVSENPDWMWLCERFTAPKCFTKVPDSCFGIRDLELVFRKILQLYSTADDEPLVCSSARLIVYRLIRTTRKITLEDSGIAELIILCCSYSKRIQIWFQRQNSKITCPGHIRESFLTARKTRGCFISFGVVNHGKITVL